MIAIREEVAIAAPPGAVWPLLADPATLWDVHLDDLIPSRDFRRVQLGQNVTAAFDPRTG
jgi:hypothetical protein